MQAQHQAYSPPICLQVVLMVYADGLRRGDGLLFVSFVSFVSSGPALSLSFSVSSSRLPSSFIFYNRAHMFRTHTHALGRVVSGWKVIILSPFPSSRLLELASVEL